GQTIDGLVIRWPGGAAEEIAGVDVNRRYTIRQGARQAVEVAPRRQVAIAPQRVETAVESGRARILTPSRPPLPRLTYRNAQGAAAEAPTGDDQTTLVNLWASWCAPCVEELRQFAQHEDQIRRAGVNILAFSVEESPDGSVLTPAAAELLKQIKFPFTAGRLDDRGVDQLDALQRALLDAQSPLPLPCSFLLDRRGAVCAIYRGPVDVPQLLKDVQLIEQMDAQAFRETAQPHRGRWRREPDLTNPFQVATKLYEGGMNDEAIAYLRRLIDIGLARGPDSQRLKPEQLYFFLGTLLEDKADYAAAQDAYEVVMRIEPQNQEVMRRLAEVAAKRGDATKAAGLLELLVRLNPADASLRFDWAERLAEMGKVNEALTQYRLLGGSPVWQTATLRAAWLLATHPDPSVRKPNEAIQLAQRLCDETGDDNPAHLDALAAAYAAAGQFDEAVTAVDKALAAAR
ncbi:MAG: redoxin domain-containing protein, partial [Planctomycetales bacterium]|nr:redoxin domain-containing protein [Planctomycetales bacterium]